MGYLNAMGLLQNNTPLRSKTGFIIESGISLQQEKDITVEGMCLSLMEFYSIASLLSKTIWSSNIPCFLRYSSHFNLSHFIMYDDVKRIWMGSHQGKVQGPHWVLCNGRIWWLQFPFVAKLGWCFAGKYRAFNFH